MENPSHSHLDCRSENHPSSETVKRVGVAKPEYTVEMDTSPFRCRLRLAGHFDRTD